MPVPQNGAQRASRRRSVPVLTALIATPCDSSPSVGAGRSQPEPSPSGEKVVIVVGPVGSSTANYIYNAKKLRVAGPLLRRHRRRDLQPQRDVGAGQEPPPRARTSSSTSAMATAIPARTAPSSEYTKDGLGLNATAGSGNATPSITASTTSTVLKLRPELGRDPQPAVLRLGQLRVGRGQPDEVGRDPAGRQLRRRLPAERCPGGLRRGHHQRVVDHLRAVPDRPQHGDAVPRLTRFQWRATTSSSVRPAPRAIGPGWTPVRRRATTARSSAT